MEFRNDSVKTVSFIGSKIRVLKLKVKYSQLLSTDIETPRGKSQGTVVRNY